MAVERVPHPWNDGFAWPDHTGPFTSITKTQAKQFNEDGFFVVEDAFDAAILAALDDAIAPGEERVRAFLSELPDGRFGVAGTDTQTVAPHLVVRSQVLRDFCAHPLLAGLARDLIGPDVRLYWEQAVYKQPQSAEPVLWHQDNGYTFVEPQAYLTCWVALTDATPENGCVAVMPGVHRHGTLRHVHTDIGEECWGDHDTAVLVPVTAGSIVVFTSLTPHCTARNLTDDVRKAYIVQYAPDGAVAYRPTRDGGRGPAESQDDDRRQFFVVRDGAPI
ncbi:MAG: phytanoyl-CoA dioxygenase family protein [Actinomycetota bacterium]|nr:phytanoyl-CoA dioxygenase family protein [Actinomycetota bacterium]